MRHALAILLVLVSAACKSKEWAVELVDDGDGRDVGAHVSMHLFVDGADKRLAIVYEDRTAGRVRIATREGTGDQWGPFQVEQVSSARAQMPASTMGPDGRVYVVFAYPDPARMAEQGNLYPYDVYSALPDGGGGWTTELVSTDELPAPLRLIDRPPSIAYDPAVGETPLMVVWSTPEGRALVQARRSAEPSGAWNPQQLGGAGSDIAGFLPSLVASWELGELRLFYGEVDSGRQGTPLVCRYPTTLGWQGPLEVGFGASNASASYQVKEVLYHDDGLEGYDHFGVVQAVCDGKPKYRHSLDAVPAQWSAIFRPPTPTDPERSFCEPSFAQDFQGHLWISAFDYDTRAPVVFHEDHNLNKWLVEFPESGLAEKGRYTALVYDPVSDEMILAYYDAGAGDLKVATRNAQSK